MPPAKPKLAQEDWDEAVRTNVDDFDMTPEEAVDAAAEEFQARYDLSAVVRAGAAAAAAHPVAAAAAALRAALDGKGNNNTDSVESAVAALAEACFPGAEEDRQPALAVAAKEEVAALLVVASAAATSASVVSLPTLRLLRRLLLRSADARAAFLKAQGVERCTDWLAQSLGVAAGGSGADDSSPPDSSKCCCWPAAALALACADAACLKSEEAKCRFAAYVPASGPLPVARPSPAAAAACPDEEQAGAVVAGGFVSLLLAGVLSCPEAPPAAVAGAAGVLRALTYADDESALASRAFTHARLLAKTHGALRDLLFALQRLSGSDAEADDGDAASDEEAATDNGNGSDDGSAALPSTRAEAVAAVLAAVRAVAANDDACRGFSDDGGVRACLGLLRRAVDAAAASAAPRAAPASADASSSSSFSSGSSPIALARSAAGALRQLANSDPVKAQLAGDGALDVIVGALGRFSGGGGGKAAGGKAAGGGGGQTTATTTAANPSAADDDAEDDDQHPSDAAANAAPVPDALEPVAGLLAAMTLRQPEVAAAAADAGAVEALCAALGRMVGSGGVGADKGVVVPAAAPPAASASAAACRQLCLAVRNMACRGGAGVRSSFLSAGAEPLLRAAKTAHPGACRDVGSAALRDLGLDNYNA